MVLGSAALHGHAIASASGSAGQLGSANGAGQRWTALGGAISAGQRWAALGSAGQRWAALGSVGLMALGSANGAGQR